MDTGWLREMGEERLAQLLLRRPDLARPAPASLAEVLLRLDDRAAVWGALRQLPRPTVQVVEAALAAGRGIDRRTLLAMIGRDDDQTAAAVDRALAQLVDYGLATIDGEYPGIHVVMRSAYDTFPYPLGLGVTAQLHLVHLSMHQLRSIAAKLGIDVEATREAAVAAILHALGDSELISRLVDSAPWPISDRLRRLAVAGGHVRLPYDPYAFAAGRRLPLTPDLPRDLAWAVERCLLIPTDRFIFEMPGEVALALRGPQYRIPFDPHRPYAPRGPADDTVVARDAVAAAGSLLRLAVRLMDDVSRGEVAVLRSGGIGVRELRRLAKAAGAGLDQVRVAFAVLHGAGLLQLSGDAVVPTDRYDAWLAEPPAERMATLVWAWAALPYAPGAVETAWVPSTVEGPMVAARAAVLRLLAAEPGAPTDDASFVELLSWSYPLLLRDLRLAPAVLAAACRAEAAILGVTGAGACSDVGRALLADDRASLAAALAGVGEAVRSAHLQADLTAVVTGTPTADLADLLGALAEREATGTASTWRFTPGSIRHALDTGWTADRVLAALADVAATEVPQALTYLVRDVARRHGVLRASAVACCVRSDDVALLAEVAADRRLRSLDLRLLAPTVLASGQPLAQTLDALRRAGYAPVAEAADGSPIVERPAPRRTARAPRPGSEADPAGRAAAFSADEALTLARTLLARPDGEIAAPPDPPPPDDDDLSDMDFYAMAALFGELGLPDPEPPHRAAGPDPPDHHGDDEWPPPPGRDPA